MSIQCFPVTNRELVLISTQVVQSLWGAKPGVPHSPRGPFPGWEAEVGTWSLQDQTEEQGEFWKVWQRTGVSSSSFPGQSFGLHLQKLPWAPPPTIHSTEKPSIKADGTGLTVPENQADSKLPQGTPSMSWNISAWGQFVPFFGMRIKLNSDIE